MIVDSTSCFQRNPDILRDVCNHRVEMYNFLLSMIISTEDQAFYESEIRHYKHYEV